MEDREEDNRFNVTPADVARNEIKNDLKTR